MNLICSNLFRSKYVNLILASILSLIYACDKGDSRLENPEPASSTVQATSISNSGKIIRINNVEYLYKLKDLFNFNVSRNELPLDQVFSGFYYNKTPVTETGIRKYWEVAKKAAEHVYKNRSQFMQCPQDKIGQKACMQKFLAEYGAYAYGRIMTKPEIERLLATYEASRMQSFEQGVRAAVEGMLMSPSFLFNIELGDNKGNLTAYELANRLARFLWVSIPDRELLASAKSGKILNQDEIKAQVDRMMKDKKFSRTIPFFYHQLLSLDNLLSRDQVDRKVIKSMRDELLDTIAYLTLEKEASLLDLYKSPLSVGSKSFISSHYDVKQDLGNGVYLLDENKRPGMLTRAAFLAASSIDDSVSPIYRGLAVAENLLCKTIGNPTEDVDDSIKPEDTFDVTGEKMTTRETLETLHSSDPCAAACHANFEPMGYAFENYSALGKYRTKEYNKPVDPSGYVKFLDESEEKFSNVNGLTDILANSEDSVQCFIKHWYSFATQNITEHDAKIPQAVQDLKPKYKGNGDSLKSIFTAIATHDSFKKVQ